MEYTFAGTVNDKSAVVRTEDNVVVNIIVAPPTEPAQEGCYLVDVSDGKPCDIGWVWNGTSFYDPDPKPQPSNPIIFVRTNTGYLLNQALGENPEIAPYIPAIHDQVYVNGEMVREDISISLPEAVPVLELLKVNFPNSTVNFESIPTNFIGTYDGYRPPYTNESISWYEMIRPTPELLSQYNVPEDMYPDIYNWYGLKHNLVTQEIMLKVVFEGTSLDQSKIPNIPGKNDSFFARLHRADGTIEPYIDCYANATEEEIIAFCAEHNIPFTSVEDKPGYTWTYGITFNYDTKEIITVKTYRRVIQ